MGLLDEAKNIISGKDPNAPKPKNPDNRVDNISQCQVIWYQWVKELASDPKQAYASPLSVPNSGASSGLADARSYDISNHIESFTFSKSMDNASGSFSLILHNSFDWSRYMRPGQWVTILLANDGSLKLPTETGTGGNSKEAFGLGGAITDAVVLPPSAALDSTPDLTKKDNAKGKTIPTLPAGPDSDTVQLYAPYIRCVGVIQRVGITSKTTADGSTEISYVVTGKDFGTIYEDTEIWFNGNNADGAAFSAAIQSLSSEFIRNLTNLLDKWHDIFLNPKTTATIREQNSDSFFPTQWVMPGQLVADLGLSIDPTSEDPYFGSIQDLKEFSPTVFENPDPFPLSAYNGRCWDKLKSLSNPDFHELFTELSDNGKPRLYFRPIPWSFDPSDYPTLAQFIFKFSDIATTDEVLPAFGSTLPPLSSALDPVASIVNVAADVSAGPVPAFPSANPSDSRSVHGVQTSSLEIESFDVGLDIHSRANFFIVDNMKSIWDQLNSLVLAKSNLTGNLPFPFRNEDDIKRNGFRPVFANVMSLNISNGDLFGNGGSSQAKFLFEAAALLKDYYATAEDLYSGTLNLGSGKNEVKLGKVLLTDSDVEGLPDMAFYIEGYTDSFTIDENGVGVWTQSLVLTRGISLHVLNDGAKIKDKQATQVKTFHAFNTKKDTNNSALSQAKSFITKPLG